MASSAIDLSDGLLGDLQHVLDRSAVDARIEVDAVPRSPVMQAQPPAVQRLCLLCGGDDYELLFSASPDRAAAVALAAVRADVAVTRIGRVVARRNPAGGRGIAELIDAQGRPVEPPGASFDHFRA